MTGDAKSRYCIATSPVADANVHRSLRRNIGAAMVARIASMATSMLIVPLSVGALTEAEYGVLSSLVSISIILGLADLGVANSLLTRLSIAEASRDDARFAREASSAWAMTLFAAAIAVLVCFVIAAAGGTPTIFGATKSGTLPAGTTSAMLIVIAVVALRNPLSVVQIARRAQLQGWFNAAIDIASSALRLVCVYFATQVRGSLTWIVAAAFLPWLVLDLLNFLSYRRRFPLRSPNLRRASRETARSMVRPASLFLLLQITTALAYSTGSLVVGHVVGLEQVQQFSVPNQMALAAISVLTAATGQLWPAISQALATEQTAWARRLVRQSAMRVLVASTTMAAAFVVFGRRFISIWTHGEVQPQQAIILGLACWIVLGSLAGLVSFVLNAMQLVGFQVALSIPASAATVLIGASMTARLGPAGMPWATTICATVLVLVPSAALAASRLRGMSSSP